MWGYEVLWLILLPFALLYLWYRGRKEPLYRQFWDERFGIVDCGLHKPIWIHSASLGELRGAAPWIHALLIQSESIFITTLTPAGRTAIQTIFADAIDTGKLQLAYVPMESRFAVRRFVNTVQPKAAVMTESDAWPVLMATIHKMGVPLAMANAQYPATSFARDIRWGNLRTGVYRLYDLVMCKSTTHAQRFKQAGCRVVRVVGETRFDLPIPDNHLQQSQVLRQRFALDNRPVLCIASAIEGEDAIFSNTLKELVQHLQAQSLAHPLCIYVPRSPQRFDAVYDKFINAGWRVLRRSSALNAKLDWQNADLSEVDVLLGDSLGEMYFYLALSDAVVVGGSFVDNGAHNVIEPLALRKPVWVGESIWGIEYPGVEAIAAGVLQQAANAQELAISLSDFFTNPQTAIQQAQRAAQFYAEHAGAVEKHMTVFMPWLKSTTRQS